MNELLHCQQNFMVIILIIIWKKVVLVAIENQAFQLIVCKFWKVWGWLRFANHDWGVVWTQVLNLGNAT